MTQPVLKRADQLVIGDRIQPGYLPAYSRSGEGVVRYVETYHYRDADWVFAAFATADGDRNSTSYLPAGKLQVIPADTGLGYSRADDDPEVTQPIAGRVPAHYGAVEVAGGLIEIDPPEGFVPASAPIADDPRDRTHGAEFESYDAASETRYAGGCPDGGPHLWVGRDGRPPVGDDTDRCDACGARRNGSDLR